MPPLIRCAFGLLCGLTSLSAARAETWVLRPQSFTGMAGTQLGSAVGIGLRAPGNALQVTLLYVGAPNQTVDGKAGAGAVQVFQLGPGGWSYATTLTASTNRIQAGAHFGAALAVSGPRVLVGAPDYNDAGGVGANAGYVQFFYENNSTPLTFASQGIYTGGGGNFGSSVAMHSGMAAVGAVNAGGGGGAGATNGCVYSFQLVTAAPQHWQPFPANDVACGSNDEQLGASVAIEQTGADSFILVAGAPAGTQGGQALAGSAQVFVPNAQATALLKLQTLTADTPAFLDVFGTSVGLDATYIYVGATGRNNGAGRVGSVTIFAPAQLIGWNRYDEYFPLAPATVGGHCGAALRVDETHDQFILGCPGSTGTVANEGTARVYKRGQFLGHTVWTESLLTYGNALHGADAMGSDVALYGDRAFAGAPSADFPAPQVDNGRWVEFAPDLIFRDGLGG